MEINFHLSKDQQLKGHTKSHQNHQGSGLTIKFTCHIHNMKQKRNQEAYKELPNLRQMQKINFPIMEYICPH